MPRPTEQQKLNAPTSEKLQGKMHAKGKQLDVEITVETTPNGGGGYDTKVKLPVSPIGTVVNQP